MLKLTILSLILSSFVFASTSWKLDYINFKNSKIRTGIKKHTTSIHRGTLVYLEGLADSMLNHEPLFNSLTKSGYDIISFDYRGQGGSSGSMNHTRVDNIMDLMELVWNKYADPEKAKILMGWSTGGLATYKYAYLKPEKTKAIILLAPGIVAKHFVGETNLWGCLTTISIYMNKCKLVRITEASLTQKDFTGITNPHIDPIEPKSPLQVPAFAINLLHNSKKSRSWKISEDVKGMVYLSSDLDTYVDAKKTISIIKKNAAHFDYYQFGNGALHELDNEIDAVTDYLYDDIIRFLDTLN